MINLNGINVKNPFFIGSGPAKYGRGYGIHENPISFFLYRSRTIKPELFGGVTSKTLTLPPHKGNYRWYAPWRVIKKLDDGWANKFGWSNCGFYYFHTHEYPTIIKKLNNLIISIGAIDNYNESLEMINLANEMKILAVEVNISCTNVHISYRDNRKQLSNFFSEAVKRSRHPLIVKLGPEKDMASFIIKAIIAEQAGINALCMINTVPTEIKGFGHCGKSGFGIKKIALELIEKTASTIKIPIIGGGGIMNMEDCYEFFNAGAQAIYFASIFFTHPLRPQKIIKSLYK